MEVREIKALVSLMKEHGLAELEIEDKKGKVRLVRATGIGGEGTPQTPAHSGSRPAPKGKTAAATGAPADAALAAVAAKGIELAPGQKLVESPMVGTFYRAPSPDSAPFVEEGDLVHKGKPLCIIEAMKMMNEIEADASGRVVKILCQNAQPVQYGQALMVLEIG